MVMILFSTNMVDRLVVDGRLRWWRQQQLAKTAMAEECDGGGVLTAAAVGMVAAEAGRLQPWRQQRQFAMMEVAEGGGGRRRQKVRSCILDVHVAVIFPYFQEGNSTKENLLAEG
jgi:hypothetical protein